MSETVVLLHGFAGTARHWDRVTALLDRERYSPLALDLGADALRTVPAVAPERFVLCGYSMGGRVALHIAAAAPERVSRLVLVSATAGIDEPVERLASDEQLAAELDNTESFIAGWRETPLFASDPDWVKEAAAEDTRRLRPLEIATMLREYGAGRLPSLWDRLATLRVPTVALAGERDTSYCEIAARLAAAMPNARCEIVAGAGHRVAIEAPQAVADAIMAP